MLGLAIIGGRVVDDRGRPVGNALVGAAGSSDRSTGRTNADGRFTLGIVSDDPVRVMARKPGFLLGILGRVPPWTLDLRMVLARGAGLAGRVVADPLPRRFRLRLARWEGDRRARATMGSVLRLPGGLFSVSRLPAGVYEIAAEAKGYRTPSPVTVAVSAGENVAGLELRLEPR